jgi:MFS family permease
MALAVAMGIGRFVYTPILPFMAEDLGLTQAQGGVIASANLLGYLVGALGAAITGLPGGRRGWFLAALAISALTTGAMGATSSMTMFLALRVIGGAASAFVMVFGAAIVLDSLAAAGRAGLSAVHFAGVGVGIAVSALVVSGLAAEGYGWRAHWLLSGGISLLALAAVVWLIPGGGSDERPAAAPRGGAIDRRLIALTIAYGLFGFGYMITATFISTMVRLSPDIHSLEPVIWLVVGLSSIPSVALWAWVGRCWGNGRSFAVACLVEGIAVVLSAFRYRHRHHCCGRDIVRRHRHRHRRPGTDPRAQSRAGRSPPHHRVNDGGIRSWPGDRPDLRRGCLRSQRQLHGAVAGGGRRSLRRRRAGRN